MQFSAINGIKILGISTALPANKSVLEINSTDGEKSFVEVYSSNEGQTISDLGFVAASSILEKHNIDKNNTGILLFVSSTPDYRSPATAFVLQNRLEIPTSCIAFDINQGNTGMIFGLLVASQLLLNSDTSYALVITGDSRSKQLDEPSVLYAGDGASAIVLEKVSDTPSINIGLSCVSSQIETIVLKEGGFRSGITKEDEESFLKNVVGNYGSMQIDTNAFLKAAEHNLSDGLQHFLSHTQQTLYDFDIVVLHTFNESWNQYIIEKYFNDNKNKVLIASPEFASLGSCNIPVQLSLMKNTILSERKIIKVLAWTFGEGLAGGFISFTISRKQISDLIFTNEFYGDGEVSHIMEA